MALRIVVPELSLVVLVGPAGSGKSSFARRHFRETEVLSSNDFRRMVGDDPTNSEASADAFDAMRYVAGKRLGLGRLTVIDASNLREEGRRVLIRLAKEHDVPTAAILFDLPEALCRKGNELRSEGRLSESLLARQFEMMRQSVVRLEKEKFGRVFTLTSCEQVQAAAVEREPMRSNRRCDHGPFDIIGDVHGCHEELVALLGKLGYEGSGFGVQGSGKRKVIFVGDLVDRGPGVVEVLKRVMEMVEKGEALCVPGNHDVKLAKKLRGRNVQVAHGLEESLRQIEGEGEAFKQRVADFIDSLVSHYVLDDGKLVVAHAGMKQQYQGRASSHVRDFALYGQTSGEKDEFGVPVRYPWAREYTGEALVVYGHTPVPEADWVGNTVNIDTGCVFGGKLSALRYPEREVVSVCAKKEYVKANRPFLGS